MVFPTLGFLLLRQPKSFSQGSNFMLGKVLSQFGFIFVAHKVHFVTWWTLFTSRTHTWRSRIFTTMVCGIGTYLPLPWKILLEILSIVFFLIMTRDKIIWDALLDGVFLTKSTYKWITRACFAYKNLLDARSWVWKLSLPKNIRHSLWIICHKSLPTNDFLVQRFFSFDSY